MRLSYTALNRSPSTLAFLRSSVAFSPVFLFTANEPGVWYDPSDVANLAWRRNLLTFTEQFDNAVWAVVTTGSVTRTASEISFPANTSSSSVSVVRQAFTSVAGDYTGSVELRAKAAGDVGKKVGIWLNDGSITNFTWHTLTSNWVRITVTESMSATSSFWTVGVLGDTAIGGVIQGAVTVEIRNAQLELGSVATDYQRISNLTTEVVERFPSATLYQDNIGTTPVITPGDPVGLMLDKSKGLVFGSELVTTTNMTSQNSNGTVATVGSTKVATCTVNGLYGAKVDSIPGVVNGRNYVVTVSISTNSANKTITMDFGGYNGRTITSTTGSLTFRLPTISGATLSVYVTNGLVGETFTVSNISVRELPGFHATASGTSRPIYGIVPLGGRRNTYTQTSDLTNLTNWPTGDISLGTRSGAGVSVTDPEGYAYIARPTASYPYTSGVNYTFSATVVCNQTITNVPIRVAGGFGANGHTLVSLQAGVPQRISVTVTATSSGLGTAGFGIDARNAIVPGGSNATGYVVTFSDPQIEIGSSATNYQRVGSVFDVTEAGVPSLSYLFFDGIDDFMVTSTITPGIDKAQIFAGVRKLTDPAFAVIAETSSTFNSFAGSLLLFTNPGLNGFVSRGSATGGTAGTISATAPITSVLTGIGDIAADVSTVQQNGVAGAAGSGDQGTGNYLAYPLYIGRRGGTLNPINMNLYSLIVRFGTNLNASTITSTETWIGGKSGVTLT